MSLQNGFQQLRDNLQKTIIGQPQLVERLLLTLLADGHLLVEGAPGLAKTKAINALADRMEGEFKRVQFTPDLLPGDITGTEIYRPETQSFDFQAGPIFHNLILADEINRAPAKVQSALLEAMAERQVTVGGVTRALPEVFMVMATQNPIEQEGTYPLPEAQLDRFLMHVKIDYPDASAEQSILRLARGEALAHKDYDGSKLTEKHLIAARGQVLQMHMSEAVEEYLVQLIIATREPGKYGDDLARWVEFGASPRGTIALDRCARAYAWLEGRDYVSPDDVRAVAHDVLRHRILLSFEAEASGLTTDTVINELLSRVPVA
ncbi:MAG TPA: MoxR family ATPase [Oceanospirillales bacterium]|nr:AAA family ATPase [Oleibacter sp. HI0075]MEC9409212.1 MoxR family ATPase [Pseudomonadota bacterium]HCG78791.1 MoxR family ATPase [Oceanospirillales bacterium]MED5440528.1 MoxR family ATPase [Pseudomonadota bacterium]MEE2749011.1 MoxR family ATPase [Pseudomonadota bacterium]